MLPSSHSSFGSTMPLPHTSLRQCDEQPSPFTRLPSSHSSSESARTKPSPQTALWQWTQRSVLSSLPSSHCSPGSTMPLPHSADVQFFEHDPLPLSGPLSHSSMRGASVSTLPSPHTLILHAR